MIASFIAAAVEDVDTLSLPIGKPGTATVGQGWYDLNSAKASNVDEFAASCDGVRFVLVGESHDNPDHHKAQAAVISALVKRGRDVTVGFEMFTRDNQKSLAGWTLGKYSQEEFIEKSSWKTQWGFDFNLYKPIFDVVKENRLPMVALNLPREWVRRVGRNGLGALTDAEKKWAPNIDTTNKDHRSIFSSMMGGHGAISPATENTYAAMVAWDEGMATTAADWMSARTSSKAVMVIVVGMGHTLYNQGINYRLMKKGFDSRTAVCFESNSPRKVSNGLADFVFVSPELARKDGQ